MSNILLAIILLLLLLSNLTLWKKVLNLEEVTKLITDILTEHFGKGGR